jgi:hypothetical protein
VSPGSQENPTTIILWGYNGDTTGVIVDICGHCGIPLIYLGIIRDNSGYDGYIMGY